MLTGLSVTMDARTTAVDRIALPERAAATVDERLDGNAYGFALLDGSAEAYNEETFQHFLKIERTRAEISNRPFLLMLVDFQRQTGTHSQIDAKVGAKLFSVLAHSVRETDFIGWYREGRIAGAVLTQHGDPDHDHLSDVVRRRVGGALEKLLPPDQVRALRVRVHHLSPHASLRE